MVAALICPGMPKSKAVVPRQGRTVGITSCCIDKSSSAELTEAINSMYMWYQNAVVCYAYLSDVENAADMMGLRESAWFTRGWTLQELLAPETVVFFDKDWRDFGTKDSLRDIISLITRISTDRLFSTEGACIAEKMSWASRRATSRTEDEAYCLLGIFGVNMPLLYGEGSKAFRRLQLEIIKVSDDESLFAWNSERFCGDMIAPFPSVFASASDIRPRLREEQLKFEGAGGPPGPYSMTNKGLHISLFLVPYQVLQRTTSIDVRYRMGSFETYIAVLYSLRDGANNSPTIFLARRKSTVLTKEDWTAFKIPSHRSVSVDLVITRDLCQQWMATPSRTMRASSTVQNTRIFILPDPDSFICDTIVDLPVKPTVILISLTPFPLQRTTANVLGWVVSAGDFRPLKIGRYVVNTYAGTSFADLCFINQATGTAILLFFRMFNKSPGLSLLKFPTHRNPGTPMEVRTLLRRHRWGEGRDQLTDRISCRFGGGASISASIRQVGGQRHQYHLNVTIDDKGSMPWPPSEDVQEANESFRKELPTAAPAEPSKLYVPQQTIQASSDQPYEPPKIHGLGQSNNAQSKKTQDFVIGKLVEETNTDPDLKMLVEAIASGEASTEQMNKFQIHLDELKRPKNVP